MKGFVNGGVCLCVLGVVRLNRDRAAELTQPVCPGVGGQQQQGEK